MLSLEQRQRQAGKWQSKIQKPKSQAGIKKLRNRASAVAAKRRVSTALRVRESALFRPVRAIGMVTDGVPFAHAKLGSEDFVTVSIGRSFQVYETGKLMLRYLGPRLNDKIQALYCVGEVVLTSVKHDIIAWHKLTELGRFKGHKAPPMVMCAVGSKYLLSGAAGEVLVWQLSDIGLDSTVEDAAVGKRCVLEPLARLQGEVEGANFGDCVAICHPPTYLNKVLVAGSEGSLSLWNIRTTSCVHNFKAHLSGDDAEGSITCMKEVPNVLDLVAIGFSGGRICILNAREDTCLCKFDQAQGRVTTLAFRTGDNAASHMVSGAPNGTMVVWDLDKRRAHHVMEDAHDGVVTAAMFLPGQPILLSLGRDNSIKEWIFDTADGIPQFLKSRAGCPGPAKRLFFYSKENDRQLLVGGALGASGFVAQISTMSHQQNMAFSQANLKKIPTTFNLQGKKRLPPLVDLAWCEVRHWDWPAIVTVHENQEAAFVWSGLHRALAPMTLAPPDYKDRALASSVAVSKCGNYVVVGFANGTMHRFNMQSGLHRGTFPKPPPVPEARPGVKAKTPPPPPVAHKGRVCGLEITAGGLLVSAASHPTDCNVRLWKLQTHEALGVIPLGAAAGGAPRSVLFLRPHGALVALALDDGVVLLVDLQGRTVVRTFACGLPATDAAFSSDGRWLAVALRGGGLRIFDLPAARCVDSFAFAKPALSVCFSPNNAYLLTSHAKGSAIQMWANKFLFDPSLSAPLLQPEPAKPINVDEPGKDEQGSDASDDEDDDEPAAKKAKVETADAEKAAVVDATPLSRDLLTLSDLPPAKWLAILHHDLVKERNKPAEAPKPLPNAPFFLPTAYDGVTLKLAAADEAEPAAPAPPPRDPNRRLSLEEAAAEEAAAAAASSSSSGQGRVRNSKGQGVTMQFQALLRKGDFDAALKHLKKQTPAGVHLCIEELGPLAGGDLDELAACLEMFLHHLRRAHYADELQAYLSLFLQAHSEELAEADDMRELCSKVLAAQENRWSSLDERCQKSRCFLGMLTQTQSQW
eukprot:TRINITY_DN17018_c0_g1_i1.p1 TRINITY_DN17018_c0_g1~~TRINITY_DN17018_c0_g1_i1.p1  ORF type:complete len:1033 (+),score=275.67 TRINITY_DN17018_c0_g1_i1:80-3178(+)